MGGWWVVDLTIDARGQSDTVRVAMYWMFLPIDADP